jgi:hypothetical protein
VERRDAYAHRAEAGDPAVLGGTHLANDGRPRQDTCVGISSLRAHPALVRLVRSAGRDCLVDEPSRLFGADAEVGQRE